MQDGESRGRGRTDRPGAAGRGKIEALVHLLGDEDPSISSAAWKHLEGLSPSAGEEIRRAASGDDDPRVRVQANRFLLEQRRQRVLEEWVRFTGSAAVDLERGALIISRSEYPSEDTDDVASVGGSLDALAADLRPGLERERSTATAVRRLLDLLHVKAGFTVEPDPASDPDSSYLRRVIERRRGSPLALTVLGLLLARRVELRLEAVALPRQYLLRYRTGGRHILVDPLEGGRRVSAADCRRALTTFGLAFSARLLEPLANRELLSRMLGDLLRAYHAGADQRRLNRVVAMLRLLEETSPPREN